MSKTRRGSRLPGKWGLKWEINKEDLTTELWKRGGNNKAEKEGKIITVGFTTAGSGKTITTSKEMEKLREGEKTSVWDSSQKEHLLEMKRE